MRLDRHSFLALFVFTAILAAVTAVPTVAVAADPQSVSATEPSEPHEWDVDRLELLLPHHETAHERVLWQGREHEMPRRDTRDDPPPLAPVRNCAEWEPCSGVLIRYPLGLPYSLLRDFDDQVTLHVVVANNYHNSAISALTSNGIDMDQVEFLVRANESIWTRDYGPWFVFDGNDEITIIDHTYNRPWRPNDNLIPIYFAEQQGLPVRSHSMYHTGGNYMTDGAHISSSTRLVYNEAASQNGMSQGEVDQLMFDYYGVENYVVLDYIESGGIHHIDTWAKFLDEETVLVKEVWESHWTYDDLQQRATLLASLTASTGRNYRVHRVYCYNIGGNAPASYTNSLILNDHIYVPFFGNSTYDQDAIAAYEEAAPGYVVQGYYYSGFLSDDALHCRAKGVMDRAMLRVGHIPIREPHNGPAPVTAHIHAHGDAPVVLSQTVYRHDGGPWQMLAMAAAGLDSFTATIPAPPFETICEYYIEAADGDDRTAAMPRIAPADWYEFPHSPTNPTAVDEALPAAAAVLHPNYPNPFNPGTTFRFDLHHAGQVSLVVVDVRGRVTRTLVDGSRAGGSHTVHWDGRDDAGRPVAAGTYFYRLQAAGLQYTRAATLVN